MTNIEDPFPLKITGIQQEVPYRLSWQPSNRILSRAGPAYRDLRISAVLLLVSCRSQLRKRVGC